MIRFLILLILLIPLNAFSTTIVILIRPNEIIIAADSRSTDIDDAGNPRSSIVSKFYQVKQFVFLISGLHQADKYNFQAEELLSPYLNEMAVYDSVYLKEFKKKLSETYSNLLKQVKSLPDCGNFPQSRGSSITKFIITGVQNNIPFLHVVSILVDDFNNNTVTIESRFIKASDATELMPFYIGEQEAIRKQEKVGLPIGVTNVYELANYLVTLEIKDKPDKVGFPVDILSVKTNGINWIQKKDSTPNVIFK